MDPLLEKNKEIYMKEGSIIKGDSFTTCVYLEKCIFWLNELQTETRVLGTCRKFVRILILLFKGVFSVEF